MSIALHWLKDASGSFKTAADWTDRTVSNTIDDPILDASAAKTAAGAQSHTTSQTADARQRRYSAAPTRSSILVCGTNNSRVVAGLGHKHES